MRLAHGSDVLLVLLGKVWVRMKRCVVVLRMSGVRKMSRGSEGHEEKIEDDLQRKEKMSRTVATWR